MTYILLWHVECPNGQTVACQPTGQDTMLATMWSVIATVTTAHLCLLWQWKRRNTTSRSREVIVSLSKSPAMPHLECGAQIGAVQYRRDMNILEGDWWRLTNVVMDVEHLIDEEGLRQLWLFSLDRRLRGISSIYINIWGGSEGDGARLFLEVCPVTGAEAMDTKRTTGSPVCT